MHEALIENEGMVFYSPSLPPSLKSTHARTHLQRGGVVGGPVLLRREAHTRPVGAAAVVRAAVRRRRGPGRAHELRGGHVGQGQDARLELGHLEVAQREPGWGRAGVLPDEHLVWHEAAEVAVHGAHVAVRQLEPGASELVRELVGPVAEAPRDGVVDGVHLQGEVRGEHDGRAALARHVRVGHGRRQGAPRGDEERRAGGRLGLLPLVRHEVLEVAVVPLGGVRRPGALQARCDGVGALAALVRRLPAEPLLLDARGLGLRADVVVRGRAVALPKRVPPRAERHGLHVVHGHATERLADVPRRPVGVRVARGALGVHVNQAHVRRPQGLLQLLLRVQARPAALPREPLLLLAPVDLLGLELVLAAAPEAEGLEAHALQRDVPRQDHQVRPRQLAAILLFDGPEQAPRLVQVAVVGPGVEGREAQHARAGAAAAVGGAVGAGGVPRHAHEEWAVVAVVRRPPLLRVRHERRQVRLDLLEVERQELLRVGPPPGQRRVRLPARVVLPQGLQVQLVGPPPRVLRGRLPRRVRSGRPMHHGTLASFRRHAPPSPSLLEARLDCGCTPPRSERTHYSRSLL